MLLMKSLSLIFITLLSSSILAQNVTLKDKKSREEALPEYPYVFPVLGKKATAKGFQLPKPHGVMLNFLAGKQKLAIEDMKVGFNNGTLYDVSEIIEFGPSEAIVYTTNIRIDTWILPFLNIGGYYGRGETQIKSP